MQATTTIGLDIAKSVFQIHGVDAAGNVIVRRQLKRYVLSFFQKLPPCRVGIEACASSHHGCTDQPANVKKSLANSEPSIHGTKLTCPPRQSMSAYWGKAESRRLFCECPVLARNAT
jgi:transposase